MSVTLGGKVALVTGAAKRIGRAVALRLAREGADVVVHYGSSEKEAESAVSEIRGLGRRAIAVRADLRSVAEIRAMSARVSEALGRLDVLVNRAANFLRREVVLTAEVHGAAALDTNRNAVCFCCQAAAPELKRALGTMVNCSVVG